MFDFMKNELHYKLGRLIDKGIIREQSTIVLFGYNHHAELSAAYLMGAGIKKEKIHIVDNFNDGNYMGIKVEKPAEVLIPKKHNYKILIATYRNREIVKQLRKYGYAADETFVTLNKNSLVYKYGSKLRIHFPNQYNRLLNGVGYKIYKFYHKDVCAITEKNKKFQNAYLGKRCFILGNGPSIKDIDLKLLKNEFVFGVNQVMGIRAWEKADINFWVCMDGDFLGLWADADLSFFYEIKKLGGKNIEAFVPIESKKNMERFGLDKILNINYVNFKLQYINLDQPVHLNRIDMSRFIIQPYNVVIASINIAIYMGFSEIYLLGCNQSVLLNELDAYLHNQSRNMHGIKDNDISETITLNRMKNKGIYFEIKTQLTQLMQFRAIAQFCEKNEIGLFNLSFPTLIESIEQKSISEVIDGKQI